MKRKASITREQRAAIRKRQLSRLAAHESEPQTQERRYQERINSAVNEATKLRNSGNWTVKAFTDICDRWQVLPSFVFLHIRSGDDVKQEASA